ncbi:MAG: signal peptidase I [Dehalococcoidia bacterium]|nr:signal peptidase I [Dehalococcoidia bacterium]
MQTNESNTSFNAPGNSESGSDTPFDKCHEADAVESCTQIQQAASDESPDFDDSDDDFLSLSQPPPKDGLDFEIAGIQSEPDTESNTNRKQSLTGIIREALITVCLAIALFAGMSLALQNSEIVSGSMKPTLENGERILVYKLAYKFGHEPQRGDIIVFTPPAQVRSDNDYIKRIIGMPGEIVEIKNGSVYIHKQDGSTLTLDEPYIDEPPYYYYISPEPIPQNNYFVMGDNRNNSADSHKAWTVPQDNIVGRALCQFWPLSKFGSALNYKLPP